MTSLEELHSFFEAILVVALSEYIGHNENGEELPSESRLRFLNNLIKGVRAPEVSNEVNESFDRNETDNVDDFEEANAQNAFDWVEWSIDIFNKAQQIAVNCTEGTAINACYNPNLAKIIKTRLMPYLVLWSGVIQSHFQTGTEIVTSTSVEAEFADLKNRTFKNQLLMRVDKFIYEHLDYIDGRIKLASCQKDVSDVHCEQPNNVMHNYFSVSSVKTQSEESIENCSLPDVMNCHIEEETQNINEENIINNNIDNIDNKKDLINP